ncbi:hypothetical protein QE357_001452 [Siphonobacter sp. BAB-5404]|nr:hypothetical protein [Siphonobacter sp. SORGH_AS_0500]
MLPAKKLVAEDQFFLDMIYDLLPAFLLAAVVLRVCS